MIIKGKEKVIKEVLFFMSCTVPGTNEQRGKMKGGEGMVCLNV